METDTDDFSGGALSDADIHWEELWQWQVLKDALDDIRATQDPKAYQAFVLLALQRRPGKEVAASLGMSETNVYVCKHRIIAALRKRAAELSKIL